ncbi:unnamed protein product [Pleuronectes platessa]|uniref:Uncharacterized protein n=1 Tax=Pleuronectes platessa TaxID=8262 RepID=A0A9N7VHC7_PLEPL|nr:unnamed protein product [Pleuronectes platessa]
MISGDSNQCMSESSSGGTMRSVSGDELRPVPWSQERKRGIQGEKDSDTVPCVSAVRDNHGATRALRGSSAHRCALDPRHPLPPPPLSLSPPHPPPHSPLSLAQPSSSLTRTSLFEHSPPVISGAAAQEQEGPPSLISRRKVFAPSQRKSPGPSSLIAERSEPKSASPERQVPLLLLLLCVAGRVIQPGEETDTGRPM